MFHFRLNSPEVLSKETLWIAEGVF